MKKQREFVADASHELRTPLTSVLANLELLQASLPEPEHEGGPGDGRFGAALFAAHESPCRRSSPARPRRRGPGQQASPLRSRRDRRQCRGGARPGARRSRARDRERARRFRSRATPMSCTGWCLTCLIMPADTPPAGARIDLRVREVGRRGGGRGRGRRSRHTCRSCASRSSAAWLQARGRPTPAVGPGSGLGLAIVRAVAAPVLRDPRPGGVGHERALRQAPGPGPVGRPARRVPPRGRAQHPPWAGPRSSGGPAGATRRRRVARRPAP